MDPITLLLGAANLVPAIAKFLNAGATTQKVADEVGSVAATIAGVSDPQEALAKIQASSDLQQKFQLAVMDKMQSWDKMYLDDVADARKRDTALQASGKRNYRADTMYILAVIMIVILVYMVWHDESLSEYTKGIVTLVLGRFLGYLDNIYNFEFGSTRASRDKDETIKKLSGDQ